MLLTDEGYDTSENGVCTDRGGDIVLDVSDISAGSVARISLALSCAHNVPFESTRTDDLRVDLSVDGTKTHGDWTYSLSKCGPIGPSSSRTVIAFSRPG